MKIDELRLSKILLCARKRKGLTQTQVSSMTGITQGTLSKVESYQCSVSAKHWFLLSRILDIPSDSVWSGYIDRGIRPCNETEKNVFKLPKKYLKNSHSSVKEIIPILQYIREKFGEEQLKEALNQLKVTDLFFVDLNNKINFLFACDLLKSFYGENLSEQLFKEIAKYSKDANLQGTHSREFQKKNNSLSLLRVYLESAPYRQDAYSYNITEKTSEFIKFELVPNKDAFATTQKVKSIFIPFKKAYIEALCSIENKSSIRLVLSEGLGDGVLRFRAIGQAI